MKTTTGKGPENSSSIVGTLREMGQIHMTLDNHNEAILLFEESLSMRKSPQGKRGNSNQAQVAQDLGNLARCHRRLGHPTEALRLQWQAMEILVAVHGRSSDHEDVSSALRLIAGCHLDRRDRLAAAKYFHRWAWMVLKRDTCPMLALLYFCGPMFAMQAILVFGLCFVLWEVLVGIYGVL